MTERRQDLHNVLTARRTPGELAPATTRPALWRELVLIAVTYAIYAWIRNVHGRDAGASAAHRHGHDIMTFEGWLHLDIERGLQLVIVNHEWITRPLSAFYLLAHIVVTSGVLIFIYWRRPQQYRRWRNILILVTVASLVVFALLPTAPPRLMPAAHVRDILARTGGLWSYNGGALEKIADPYAAMPSLHLGWSCWCAAALAGAFAARWSWRRRALFYLYPLTVAFYVVALGTHWFVDTLAGAATLLLSVVVYDAVVRRVRRPSREDGALPEPPHRPDGAALPPDDRAPERAQAPT